MAVDTLFGSFASTSGLHTLHRHPGAAQRNPGSITADGTGGGVTPITWFLHNQQLWIPGSCLRRAPGWRSEFEAVVPDRSENRSIRLGGRR
ncbi:hypothetical protein Maq22A_c28775 [Methylobacterium aquaticum]|uniref:Uncharacterized protein n=1 Tax=Methylobacterium aquaticum TaxID=270351 RepID=A0A1Y0ZCA7_9HYPH|nr:hypothetical protein Maq22A_c28775 [Methylobacterium aquaticum]